MEKVNIAEILKDCPKGMELYCTIFSDVTLYRIDTSPENEYPIRIETKNGNFLDLTKYGTYSNVEEAKCVIFPKGKTTWEGFVPPCEFKDGDICYIKTELFEHIFIFKVNEDSNLIQKYVNLSGTHFYTDKSPICSIDDIKEIRLATEEEKTKLFQTIKNNGYRWSPETKTLEEFVKPKFKDGDRVVKKGDISTPVSIVRVGDKYYYHYSNTEGTIGLFPIAEQDDWELVSNKFDITTLVPFESKVLVRHNKDNKWCGSFFSHIDGNFHSHCYKYVTIAGKSYPMCIPYEKNEHLLGTTNDCDEYFKNWE